MGYPASFRLLVPDPAEFLHGAAPGLDVVAESLTGQALPRTNLKNFWS
jgi:hypothetical protein